MIIDTLAVSNYTITNNTSDVTLYQDQTTHVEVKRLMANGEDGTETTTEIK
jgi:hypothetical protein